MPLSSIRGRTLQEQGLAKRPGFIGVASDLVDYDPSLKDVVENLLGRTVIVETLEFAVAMAKGYSNRFRIVTLDGQVVNPGGSMTGGSVSREAGILSRANEMKKLSEMLKTLNESERTLEAELQEAARSAAEVEFQLTTVRGELRQAEDEVLRFEGNEKQADLLVAAAAEKIHAAQDALQALENRSNDDLKRSQELKQAAAHFEQELAQLQASIDAMHTGQSGLQEKASQVSAAITELRMEMASCEAERTTALQNVAQLQQLQQDMQGDYSQKQQTIAQYEAQIEQTREKIEALQSEKAALGETLQAGRQTLQSILSRRQEIEAQKTQTDREIQEKNKNLMLMERECARLEQKKVTSGMEEKQILDRLWDSYELTRTTAGRTIRWSWSLWQPPTGKLQICGVKFLRWGPPI